MKSKANQVITVYILIAMFVVIVSHKILQQFISNDGTRIYVILKDIIFVVFTGIIFKLILSKNDQRNTKIFKK